MRTFLSRAKGGLVASAGNGKIFSIVGGLKDKRKEKSRSGADDESSEAARQLSDFLSRYSSRIAKSAARHERVALPDIANIARRRLLKVFRSLIGELGRLLDAYGEGGVRLFGEKLRGRALELAALDLPIRVLLDEQAAFHHALVETWGDINGAMPPDVSRLLGDVLGESMFHAADVWVRRRRIEGAAFREVALLQVVVDSLDEAIMVFEIDGTVSFVTPALARVVGVDPRQVIDVPSDELLETIASLNLRNHRGRPISSKRLPWRRSLLAGEPVHEEALLFRRPDTGREGVVELFANPVKNEEGRLRGVIVTLRDRTERHRVFFELEQAYSDLRRMHSRVLSRSHLETVGGLVRGAVHALNNELNVLMMKARHVVDEPGFEGSEEAMMASAHEMAGVLARLQDFALPPHERPPVAVDLVDAVREMRALTHSEFGPGAPVSLVTKMAELPNVLAQPELLVELLTTLVLVAKDLTTGGHRLHLEAGVDGDEVSVVLWAGGRRVEAHKTQATDDDVDDNEQSRLALPMARELVAHWGGALDIGDQAASGRLVSMTLRVAPPEEKEEEAARPAPTSGRVRRVLVVDDDRDNAEVLSEVLNESGLDTRTVFSGTQALVDADEKEPDVVLLDLHLPDMLGWEVAKELRKRHPSVRIAVVSGLATPGVPEEKEVDAVFRKPLDAETIVDFVIQ